MNTQLKFTTISDATKAAIKLSKQVVYSSVIFSSGEYYVEDDISPFIRSFEKVVATYQDGKKLK